MSICTKATLIPKFTIFSTGAISLASLQLEVGHVATTIFLLKYFKTSWDKYAHPPVQIYQDYLNTTWGLF
jgi:hypothetical protein